ncbi:MAG TPA: hypothetical protein DEG47_06785, partial [Cyanobacteria bacterium UBA11148]|nr:hypothetical protein [Cyanobacteria bacterium UBA11148]
MRDKPDLSSLPSALQRVALTLRTIGAISLWVQAVLGVISTVILIFAAFSGSVGRQGAQASSQGTGFGIFFAICGVVAVGAGAYFALRYSRIGRDLLATNTAERPSKGETLQVIRLGLMVNMVGMLLTILGGFAIVGSILAKSVLQPQGALTT